MSKYYIIGLGCVLMMGHLVHTMELIEIDDDQKQYKTLQEARWPVVSEDSYFHTLNLQKQSFSTLGGLEEYMPEAINKYAIISLNVSHNYLQDLDMKTIMSCLTSLEDCNASHNQLTKVPIFMKRLKRLNLSGNLIKKYCIDDYTPEEELDLSNNPLDSLTCTEIINWRDGVTPILRLCDTNLTDEQIQELCDKYVQVIHKNHTLCNVLGGTGLVGGLSFFTIALCSSISGKIQIAGYPFSSSLIIMGGSLFGGFLNAGLTYGALRLCCCKQAMEDEKLWAEQLAFSNIIVENVQDDQGELIELDLLT